MMDYDPFGTNHNYNHSVAVDKITHLTKYMIGGIDLTIIHLVTGQELMSKDSIKTLSARMED